VWGDSLRLNIRAPGLLIPYKVMLLKS